MTTFHHVGQTSLCNIAEGLLTCVGCQKQVPQARFQDSFRHCTAVPEKGVTILSTLHVSLLMVLTDRRTRGNCWDAGQLLRQASWNGHWALLFGVSVLYDLTIHLQTWLLQVQTNFYTPHAEVAKMTNEQATSPDPFPPLLVAELDQSPVSGAFQHFSPKRCERARSHSSG